MSDNCSLPVLAGVLACALAKDLSADDITVLAALLCSVGDNLGILAAQRAKCENAANSSNE